MRGLTTLEREVLTNDYEFVFGEPRYEELLSAHERCHRLGWMSKSDSIEVIDGREWDVSSCEITKRGRVALELDALVRASVGG